MTPPRRLLVLRHGDAASPPRLPDDERPLLASGTAQVRWAGRLAAARGWQPEVALVSPALRTQQSLEAFCAGGGHTPQRRIEATLYQGNRDALAEAVQLLPDRVGTAVLVGHNPAISGFVLGLGADEVDRFPQLGDGMRPGMLAVLSWSGGWDDLDSASLVEVAWAGRQPA